jgi:hypothetical protein
VPKSKKRNCETYPAEKDEAEPSWDLASALTVRLGRAYPNGESNEHSDASNEQE